MSAALLQTPPLPWRELEPVLLAPTLALAADRVANVRLAVARVLVAVLLCESSAWPPDEDAPEQLDDADVRRIDAELDTAVERLRVDSDRDVLR